MSAPAPSIEEIVAALTARLASALEIRSHAARLIAVADAQEGLARKAAIDAFGDAEGERLYQAVSAIHGLRQETRSRVAEVPDLAADLAAPWDTASASPAPAGPGGPPAEPRASDAVTLLHGVAVEPGDMEAAGRLVDEARQLAAADDRAALNLRAGKLVGRHRWRRDLLEAAFATFRAEIESGSASDAEAPHDPAPASPQAAVAAAQPADGPAGSEADDLVFGDGPDASPVLPRRPVESGGIQRPPVIPPGEALPDPGGGWSGTRPGARSRGGNGTPRTMMPGLFGYPGEA